MGCSKSLDKELEEKKATYAEMAAEVGASAVEDLSKENIELAKNFYDAMQRKDYQTMNSLYSFDATFSDPVFRGLDTSLTKAMWAMLMKRAKNWSLSYEVVSSNQHSVTTKWIGRYQFSKTGRDVENHVTATMFIVDGKIKTQIDQFDFWKWSKMALGAPGILLGWTSFLNQKVSNQAVSGLKDFMIK